MAHVVTATEIVWCTSGSRLKMDDLFCLLPDAGECVPTLYASGISMAGLVPMEPESLTVPAGAGAAHPRGQTPGGRIAGA